MNKIKFPIVVLTASLFFACVSQQIGLKENWIDERDVMALRDMPIEQWVEKAGLPTLVEIVGDTNIYYYNYRPTLYAVAVYDSTTFIKSWGTASEQKPSLANKADVWGSRKDVMQIKVLKGAVLSAIVTEGPDKKVFIRDLNGNIVLDPNSGYNTNISDEQKVNNSFKEFSKIFSNLQGVKPAAPPPQGQPQGAAPTVAPTAAHPVPPPPPAPAAAHPAPPPPAPAAAHPAPPPPAPAPTAPAPKPAPAPAPAAAAPPPPPAPAPTAPAQ
ncbi:MAG: hypothetical protein LBC64_03125 [Fibromonadaceae bacterium]|jgi:hypothetical protein|nr:hypothetical protein [Fibromonadaceae bacterium]